MGAVLALAVAGQVALGQAQPGPAEDAPRQPDAGLAALYHQLQILQDDVRALRGLVEEQDHRIDLLIREQRERYLELDRRLLDMRDADAPADGGDLVADADDPEQAAYNQAFAAIAEARRLPSSEQSAEYRRILGLMQAVMDDYSGGRLTPNALYWTGELRVALAEAAPAGEAQVDLELARQAFAQVANLFAEHDKAPDALYKLGIVYDRLGDRETALVYLDRIVREHPQTPSARLAERYARELR